VPLSQTENIARALFKTYLPNERVVYGVRPDWLMNPETGNCLELDLYWPDLKMAAEIDGSQHFRFTPGLQSTYADFEKQQRHDTHKIQVCAERGITFHRFSIFELLENRFDPFIKSLLISQGKLGVYEHTAKPNYLYAQAERLSRSRVVSTPKRKPGLWPLMKRVFGKDKKAYVKPYKR
jgi:hypothetical protein